MHLRIDIVTPATTTVIDIPTLRQHQRIDNSADDNLLAMYLAAATSTAEKYLNRSILPRTLMQTFSATVPHQNWPMTSIPFAVMPLGVAYAMQYINTRSAAIFYGPVSAVSSVTSTDWDGNTTTHTLNVDYKLDLAGQPARIRFLNEPNFQSVAHYQITYTAGWTTVPAPVVQACMLMATHMYEHRGDDGAGSMMDAAVKNLLSPYKETYLGGNWTG